MSVMQQLDEWVKRTGNGRYADPFAPDAVTPIQQVRAEVEELTFLVLDVQRLHSRECGTSYRGCAPDYEADAIWKGRPRACLDIGLGEFGGTRYLWSLMFGTVVTVEDDSMKCHAWFQRNPDDRRTIINQSSHDPSTRGMIHDSGRYDFLHIDGDHTYEGIKQDYLDYSPMVRPGGVVAIHDLLLPDVNHFVCNLEYGNIDGKRHEIRRILHSTHVGYAVEVM